MDRKTIYRFKNGSNMYGLTTPSSDVDFMEVFLPNPEDVLGLKQVEVVDNSTKTSSEDRRNTKDDVDDSRYTLQTYLKLLIANNPNILETLFVPMGACEVRSPLLDPILNHPEKIVSKESYKTFNGYAKSQEHKLFEKKARYDELVHTVRVLEVGHREKILDSKAIVDEALTLFLNDSLKHYKGSKNNVERFHVGLPLKVIYEKLKEERDTYGWRVKTDTFLTLGYDTKFGSHLVRLYFEAEELLKTGRISFPFTGEAYDTIMKVKLGGMGLDELTKLVEDLRARVDVAYANTKLPEHADRDYVNDYLVETMLEHFTEIK